MKKKRSKQQGDYEQDTLGVDLPEYEGDDADPSTEDLSEDETEKSLEFSDDDSFDDAAIYRQYLKDASCYQLLTREEEIAIARRIDNGNMADEILSTYFSGDDANTLVVTEEMVDSCYHQSPKDDNEKFPFEQEMQLKYDCFLGADVKKLKNIVADGKDAVNDMVCHNLRLVCSISKRYVGALTHGISMNDLIQEGNIGLIKAANKFAYRSGYKFCTYAHFWIIQTIGRAVANKGNTIRIPVHVQEVRNKYDKTKKELAFELFREPTLAEVAARMKMNPDKLAETLAYVWQTVSFETPVNSDADLKIERYIVDSGETPEEKTLRLALQIDMKQVLSGLTEKEQRIIIERFGLDGTEAQTLDTLGRKYNVTRERIRQMENAALEKLRQAPAKKALQEYQW